jgi:hypothetical protein
MDDDRLCPLDLKIAPGLRTSSARRVETNPVARLNISYGFVAIMTSGNPSSREDPSSPQLMSQRESPLGQMQSSPAL